MRVTNQMMTNNMLSHINSNKSNMSRLENQYSTGKKILRPSDDPIVAVRALKLRSNLTELNQYLEKNIPDAESWMSVTESALDKVNDILTSMNKYCVQGSTDALTAKDRTSILQNLIQIKEQIYQEGNSQYAGRYVFTGYKTDTPLIYTDAKNYSDDANTTVTADGTTTVTNAANNTFEIDLSADQLQTVSKVSAGGTTISDVINTTSTLFGAMTIDPNKAYYLQDTNKLVLGGNLGAVANHTSIDVNGDKFVGYTITETFKGSDVGYFSTVTVPTDTAKQSELVTVNRLQLSYDNIYTQTSMNKDGKEEVSSALKQITYTTNGVEDHFDVKTLYSSETREEYKVGDNDVIFVADKGELIFGKNVAAKLKDADNISVNYQKNSFNTNELKPEHFFDCSFTNAKGETINYKKESQAITYEVNFAQTLKVNTEAKEAITHDIDRLVDDITTAVNNVATLETKLTNIKTELDKADLSDADRTKLEQEADKLENALALGKSVMQQTFSAGITATAKFQDKVNVAVADLGSRAKRLELTKDRLEDQQVELEDLKSSNEDVDLVETVIRYKSAEAIYTSSLSATGSVVKTSLLNFL